MYPEMDDQVGILNITPINKPLFLGLSGFESLKPGIQLVDIVLWFIVLLYPFFLHLIVFFLC